MSQIPPAVVLNVDGEQVVFECSDDLITAFKQIKCQLFKHHEKSKESKRRGARFLKACIESGQVKDPGRKVLKYCNIILQ